MRRTLALLCVTAAIGGGLAAASPSSASPAPAAPASRPSLPSVDGEVLVGYVAGAGPDARQRALGRASSRLAERLVHGGGGRSAVDRVQLPAGTSREQAVAELRSDPAVAYVEPNYLLTHQATATDPFVTDGRLWGVYGDASTPANAFGSQAAEAWAAGNTGSSGVYVGVIDEGIQFSHPDLDANVWTNPFDPVDGRDNDRNGYVDDVHGWDFANGDRSIYDGGTRGSLDDHGTHVAGTIAGEANNGRGVAGVTWSTTLISGKFLGRSGGSLAAAVKAVDYFTDLKKRHGLNLVATSNSWGGGGYSQSLFDAISRANDANILFVAAAGNSGTDNDATKSYPSGYDLPNVIAVAAIDKAGGLASFSQYGKTTVDLGAPGVDVWSTTAFNTYSTYSGTSMATPHVTGAAALYAASHPGASAATIKGAIISSAVPTASLSGKTVTGGRLDASGF